LKLGDPESVPIDWLDALPALLVVTDADGYIVHCHGEIARSAVKVPGYGEYLANLFNRSSALFLETYLWPLLRGTGRLDEVYAPLVHADETALPCFVSARYIDTNNEPRILWLFFPATQRAQFEKELLEAKEVAQRLATKLQAKNRRLDELARTDPLTGLGNRRVLREAYRLWRTRDGERSCRCAILMIDIDHFKQINDRFGHDEGDRVLLEVARCLRRCVRRSDVVVRYGGEEFSIWLPDASSDIATRVAEKIHACVREIDLPTSDLAVTVSIGIASSDDAASVVRLSELLRKADDALYRAKSSGRNRTVLARKVSW
jgi:sigma-B regulation protein RsbU (phosphoserine phosphatase)